MPIRLQYGRNLFSHIFNPFFPAQFLPQFENRNFIFPREIFLSRLFIRIRHLSKEGKISFSRAINSTYFLGNLCTFSAKEKKKSRKLKREKKTIIEEFCHDLCLELLREKKIAMRKEGFLFFPLLPFPDLLMPLKLAIIALLFVEREPFPPSFFPFPASKLQKQKKKRESIIAEFIAEKADIFFFLFFASFSSPPRWGKMDVGRHLNFIAFGTQSSSRLWLPFLLSPLLYRVAQTDPQIAEIDTLKKERRKKRSG